VNDEIVLVPVRNILAAMEFSSIDLCHQAFRFLDSLKPHAKPAPQGFLIDINDERLSFTPEDYNILVPFSKLKGTAHEGLLQLS